VNGEGGAHQGVWVRGGGMARRRSVVFSFIIYFKENKA